jgi:hypothetical protein
MILWIEHYSNWADNAGFTVHSIGEAAIFATSDHQYAINGPCNILKPNNYRFTLKNDTGDTIVANKIELKRMAKQLLKNSTA